MNSYYKKSDVLMPSTGSLGLAFAGLAAGIAFLILPKLGGDFLPQLLFGQEASDALASTTKANYGDVLMQFFNNDIVGQAVVFGTWMFIGLCVFIVLNVLAHVMSEIVNERRALERAKRNRNQLLLQALEMLGFRIIVAIVWTALLMVGLRFAVNYFAITGFIALAGGSVTDWLTFLAACLVLMLTIHLQVVMARLLVGRVRLWQS